MTPPVHNQTTARRNPKPHEDVISNTMFARQMDEERRDQRRARMTHACGPLTRSEIAALTQRAADVRVRYINAALEAGGGRGAPTPDMVRELSQLRQCGEELERALDTLRDGVENGEITVEGVSSAAY